MKFRILVPLLASLALSASVAMAQDAPTPPPAPSAKSMARAPWHMNKDRMAKHHDWMCTDLYPHAVGRLAYVETKLALTAKQKPLFERWKKVKLENVKAHADECATMAPRAMNDSIVDRMKTHEAMMKDRLASLKSEIPPLEALVASLSDEQKHVLDHSRGMFGDGMGGGRGMFGGRMHDGHGMMGRGHGRHGGFDMDDDDDAPPPPPPAK